MIHYSIFLAIDGESTFGDLAGDFLVNEEMLPDFWIRKVDPEQNCVTETKAWWEFQDSDVRVRDAFPKAEGQETRRIELIAREREYVMALIHDNGKEKCHPVGAFRLNLEGDAKYAKVFFADLPRKPQFTRDYLHCVFQGRKVEKILKLKDGSDVSHVMFDRRKFLARTNPVYVEVADMAPEAAPTRVGTV